MPTRSSSVGDALAPVGAAVAKQLAEVPEQFLGRQVVVERRVLRKVADALAHGEVADRTAENLGTSRGRINQLHQQLQRGRLAGAVRAEKAEHFAAVDLERQAIQRAVRAPPPEADRVVLGEFLDSNRRRHGR